MPKTPRSPSRIFRPFEVRGLSEEGTLAGYGSVFGVEDSYGDVVAPGAFTRSLRERGMPRMLWQHDTSLPIGIWTRAVEDNKGLYLEGQLAIKTQLGHDAHEFLKLGALDGLSIGFSTKKATFDEKSNVRTLTDVDLWEVSPVTFPSNEEARIESVKTIDPRDPKYLEEVLREAGLSRNEAKGLLAKGLGALREAETQQREAVKPDEEVRELHSLLQLIRTK